MIEKGKSWYWGAGLLAGTAVFFFRYFVVKNPVLICLAWAVAAAFLVPVAEIDRTKHIIPNKIVLVVLALAACLFACSLWQSGEYGKMCFSYIGGAFFGGGVFWIGGCLSKGGIGAGDIKLFAVLGFLLGFQGVYLVLLFTVLISGGTGIVLLLFRKKRWKDTLPLAPFALLALLLAVLSGVA